MWTTLSLILTILVLILICSWLVRTHIRLLARLLDQERTTNRELLGLSPGLMQQTSSVQQIKPLSRPEELPSDPLDEFERLSPEIQDALMREYQEEMSKNPKNIREHPGVPSFLPGQPIQVS